MPLGSSALFRSVRSLSHALARWFPVPNMLLPRAAGIDISDSSIKWLVLNPAHSGHADHADREYYVRTYGELPLEPGIVESGIVQDVEKLADALRTVRKELRGIRAAHAALPEEAAYVFSMDVPSGTPRDQVLRMIEFEFEGRVPIPPAAAVYDYTVIPSDDAGHTEISVVVFPHDVAAAYVDAFQAAGIELLSLEIEARSIARAISSCAPEEPISLIVDFGRARTGFAVVKRGIPIFTSTVEVGGDFITRALTEKMAVSPEDVEKFKNEQGVIADASGQQPLVEAVSGTASALADEVARHYHYWDTRRNEHGDRMTPVGRILLVGGNANLRGLTDYVSGRVHADTRRGNVWRNVTSFEDYIPPIDRHESLQYATAVGLALRGHDI